MNKVKLAVYLYTCVDVWGSFINENHQIVHLKYFVFCSGFLSMEVAPGVIENLCRPRYRFYSYEDYYC